jgi:hypothetical protein
MERRSARLAASWPPSSWKKDSTGKISSAVGYSDQWRALALLIWIFGHAVSGRASEIDTVIIEAFGFEFVFADSKKQTILLLADVKTTTQTENQTEHTLTNIKKKFADASEHLSRFCKQELRDKEPAPALKLVSFQPICSEDFPAGTIPLSKVVEGVVDFGAGEYYDFKILHKDPKTEEGIKVKTATLVAPLDDDESKPKNLHDKKSSRAKKKEQKSMSDDDYESDEPTKRKEAAKPSKSKKRKLNDDTKTGDAADDTGKGKTKKEKKSKAWVPALASIVDRKGTFGLLRLDDIKMMKEMAAGHSGSDPKAVEAVFASWGNKLLFRARALVGTGKSISFNVRDIAQEVRPPLKTTHFPSCGPTSLAYIQLPRISSLDSCRSLVRGHGSSQETRICFGFFFFFQCSHLS